MFCWWIFVFSWLGLHLWPPLRLHLLPCKDWLLVQSSAYKMNGIVKREGSLKLQHHLHSFLLSIKFNIVSVVGTWAFVWNQGFWLSRPLMKMIDLQKMTVKKNLHQMIIVSKYVYIVHILARFFCDLFEVGYLAYQSRRAYGKQIFCAWYWCYKINNDQLYTAFAASVFLRLSIYLLPSYVNQNCML